MEGLGGSERIGSDMKKLRVTACCGYTLRATTENTNKIIGSPASTQLTQSLRGTSPDRALDMPCANKPVTASDPKKSNAKKMVWTDIALLVPRATNSRSPEKSSAPTETTPATEQ